ncbi:4'-phosphopantetheinyl transferase superfamily protein [Streptomyces sp. NPDC006208]|uniref:4'-phosphopantetheinyl transferase family protein n=1 Tax=Streptomyces sp. NPDC006208 TaxID=3156734 RepID=UPI00339FAE4B
MIELILPSHVAASEAFRDPLGAVLFPSERRLIEKAVDSRKREFTTARLCARKALGMLGLPPRPILPNDHGAPQWPEGVVGSITHCAGYRAAALARTTDVMLLGIDAEPNLPLPKGILESIALPEEQRRVRRMRRVAPEVHWDRLLFGMKECVYKSWYPYTGQRLEFEDADISFDAGVATFTAQLRLPHDPPRRPSTDRLEGRWLAHKGLLITAISLATTSPCKAGDGVSSAAAPPGVHIR